MRNTLTTFSKIIVCVMIAAQLLLISNFTGPKKAEAFWGIGDFSFDTIIGNIYDVAKDIGIAAAKRIALNYSNRFLNRFVDKVVDKYKIKNFLYYDQVLSNYYLNTFLRDKVNDPDLRRIYTLLESAYITGQPTGTTGGVGVPNPRNALIPRLKGAIADLYEEQTGIDPSYIANPPANTNRRSYLAQAQYFYFNNPGYTEANLRGRFGEFQSSATTASQLEVLVGNSMKSSRSLIGGSCEGASLNVAEGQADPKLNPQSCATAGGTWKTSALDNARSFISNPTSFLEKELDKAIDVIFKGSYDPNNIWSAIGSSLGNFIFRKLDLDKTGGVLNESGEAYTPDNGSVSQSVNIDTDADGIPDGEDTNRDGDIEVCHHGGVPPNECKQSSQVSSSPYFTPLCKAMEKARFSVEELLRFVQAHKDQFEDGENFENEADADIWSRRAQRTSSAIDDLLYTIENFNNANWDSYEILVGRGSHYMSRVVESLMKDQDLDLAWIGNGGGGVDGLDSFLVAFLDYLIRVQNAIGRCEDPNDGAVNSVPAPDLGDPGQSPDNPGGAPCGNLLTGGATQGQDSVRTAMDAVLADWESSTDVSGFRDAVAEWLNNNGFEAARGHNGNCNSSANNLAIRINSTMGVLYEIARDGAGCNNEPNPTIGEATPCRPLTGYVGRWSYVGQGIRP